MRAQVLLQSKVMPKLAHIELSEVNIAETANIIMALVKHDMVERDVFEKIKALREKRIGLEATLSGLEVAAKSEEGKKVVQPAIDLLHKNIADIRAEEAGLQASLSRVVAVKAAAAVHDLPGSAKITKPLPPSPFQAKKPLPQLPKKSLPTNPSALGAAATIDPDIIAAIKATDSLDELFEMQNQKDLGQYAQHIEQRIMEVIAKASAPVGAPRLTQQSAPVIARAVPPQSLIDKVKKASGILDDLLDVQPIVENYPDLKAKVSAEINKILGDLQ
jgi:hypothetical protein